MLRGTLDHSIVKARLFSEIEYSSWPPECGREESQSKHTGEFFEIVKAKLTAFEIMYVCTSFALLSRGGGDRQKGFLCRAAGIIFGGTLCCSGL